MSVNQRHRHIGALCLRDKETAKGCILRAFVSLVWSLSSSTLTQSDGSQNLLRMCLVDHFMLHSDTYDADGNESEYCRLSSSMIHDDSRDLLGSD
eukprot:6401906-Amphidinium_carterae.2